MKLIIQNDRVVGTATDEYTGPEAFMTAPPDFDVSRMGDYVVIGGVLSTVSQTEWLIDKGPFFDRFGAAKMAVLTSTDAVVKAILADIQIRQWIDLERTDVATSLAYVGTRVPEVTPALQTAILTTPVAPAENLVLRKLFF